MTASAPWLGVILGIAVAVGAVDQEQKVEIICYYASDQRDNHGVTIGLVIRYLNKSLTSSPQDSDQVEEATVMSIGE